MFDMKNPIKNVNPNFSPSKGTTGVALRFKDGVVLAADRRASMGYLVASKRAKKVHMVTDRIAIGISGLVSDAMALVDFMRSELKLYELENEYPATVAVAAKLLSVILYGGYRRYFPYWVQLVLGGVDRTGPHIYSLDLSGSVSEEDYFTIGSGSPMSFGVLEAQYKPDLTKEEALNLAITALKTSIARDLATGNGIDALVITADGVETKAITLTYKEEEDSST